MTKALPIPFSAPMMASLFAGTKTQTRRIIRAPRWAMDDVMRMMDGEQNDPHPGKICAYARNSEWHPVECPYGGAGDRLWVKEALAQTTSGNVVYRARRPNSSLLQLPLRNGSAVPWPWKGKTLGAMYCPRWASRLTLEITNVRAERLQDISEEDAIAEGINVGPDRTYAHLAVAQYQELWNSINGPDFWDLNPWVWAITFQLIEST